jgi:hypothetical protein
MRRTLALLLALAAVSADAGPRDFTPRVDRRDRLGNSGQILKLLVGPYTGYNATAGTLQTSDGTALTFTRASTRTCTEPTTGAIASLATGKPCVTSQGLVMEPLGTNVCLQSEDLSTTWAVVSTAAVTTNTWDFGMGSATGDTVTDSDAVNRAGVAQSVNSTTTGAWTASCFAQSGTSTKLAMKMTITGGTGTSECDFTDLSTTTQRKTCTVTAGAGVTSVRLDLLVSTAGTDTGSVKLGGCQLETGSVATSYIPTTGTAATRAAETATVPVPASLSRTEGCAKACFVPSWTGTTPANARLVMLGGSAIPLYAGASASTVGIWDGTTFAGAAANAVAGQKKCFRSTWSAASGVKQAINATDNVVGATSPFTTLGLFTSVFIGFNGGSTEQANGTLSDIILGTSPGACQ